MKSTLRLMGLTKTHAGAPVCPPLHAELGAAIHLLDGPNGCGKSTLLQLLAGVTPVDHGDAELNGVSLAREPERYKARMTWLPDRPNLYPFLSGREWLQLMLDGRTDVPDRAAAELAQALRVEPLLDHRFDALSLGQQRKLMLTACLAAAPALLLLDEPTNGLDADAQAVLGAWLAARHANCVIVLASHESAWLSGLPVQRLRRTGGGWLPAAAAHATGRESLV